MAVYELLESGHPTLSVPLTEVTNDQEGREQIQQDLVDTMRAKNGIGLSANQIGIGARVFTMYADVKQKDIIVCFNPKIVNKSEEEILRWPFASRPPKSSGRRPGGAGRT